MNILISGGAGYIGSHIVEQLIQKKINVVIIDNLKTGHKKLINKKAKFIKANISNKGLLRKTINKYRINSIIHLAAYLNVSEAEIKKKKYYKNNILATKLLLESAKNTTVKNIIFSSSCSVYGNVKGAVSETKKINPQGYYAYTKYKGEELIKKYSKKNKFRYGILRYFNVAGASPSGLIGEIETSHGHLIKNIAIQSLKKNPKIKIYGNDYETKDGTCIRDYIHVTDLADVHISALEYLFSNNTNNIYDVFNVGTGEGKTVKEVIDCFKKVSGKKIQYDISPRRKGDVISAYADTSKAKKILNWKSKVSFENAIDSAWKWEQNR